MGAKSIYGSLWVVSESAANSKKGVFYSKDLPSQKLSALVKASAAYPQV